MQPRRSPAARLPLTRRDLLRRAAASGAGLLGGAALAASSSASVAKVWHAVDDAPAPASTPPLFEISLAQWSLHRLLFDGQIQNTDFAAEAAAMGFSAIEYVSGFFKDKAQDAPYLRDLNARAAGAGVKQLLIMCDGEGDLGDPDDAARAAAVENHRKWITAAATLGCHAIRVNAASKGTWDEQVALAADGLRRLCQIGHEHAISVIVENHGGLSSNGAWLSEVMRRVDHPRCGTLPDFGNFCMDWSRQNEPDAWYDRYQGTQELMAFARAVSAKSYDFDEHGNETTMDYPRLVKIVLDSGYRGFIGVEYEGSRLDPRAGSLATKALLERVRAELSS
jgi:sugar phosphate isomerase/epimerase